MTTYRFREARRKTTIKLNCDECGKELRRTFTGTATYNPFNDGDPIQQAAEEADRLAATAEREGVTCKWCEEAPLRAVMFAVERGEKIDTSWGSAGHTMVGRGHLKEIVDRSPCPCCKQQRYIEQGHEITSKGQRFIAKARGEAVSNG